MRFQTFFIVLIASIAIYLQRVASETSLELVTTSSPPAIKRNTLKQNFMHYLNCNNDHVDANRPFCHTIKSKIHIIEQTYYFGVFKVKFLKMQLFDHIWRDLMVNNKESNWETSTKLYSRLEMNLNHNTIRKTQRKFSYFERKVMVNNQEDWVRHCENVYFKIDGLLHVHESYWVDLIYRWDALYHYYLKEYPSTGLDMYEVDVRDRRIFQEWSLLLYKSTRMVQNQKRDIRDLIPKYLKHSLNSSDPLFAYYNDTQSKMLWNTLALAEKNLKDVSSELFFGLYNSFSTIQYGVPIGTKQKSSMVADSKNRRLWIKVPLTSNMGYFFRNSSMWEITKYLVWEIITHVTDRVKRTGMVEKIGHIVDQDIEKLIIEQLHKDNCKFPNTKGLYCQILREALVMAPEIRTFRKKLFCLFTSN